MSEKIAPSVESHSTQQVLRPKFSTIEVLRANGAASFALVPIAIGILFLFFQEKRKAKVKSDLEPKQVT